MARLRFTALLVWCKVWRAQRTHGMAGWPAWVLSLHSPGSSAQGPGDQKRSGWEAGVKADLL